MSSTSSLLRSLSYIIKKIPLASFPSHYLSTSLPHFKARILKCAFYTSCLYFLTSHSLLNQLCYRICPYNVETILAKVSKGIYHWSQRTPFNLTLLDIFIVFAQLNIIFFFKKNLPSLGLFCFPLISLATLFGLYQVSPFSASVPFFRLPFLHSKSEHSSNPWLLTLLIPYI